jgi:glutamate-1-semialdehyde aminotransferase
MTMTFSLFWWGYDWISISTGGVQELLNVDADIICFGKVIGGGLPVGALQLVQK